MRVTENANRNKDVNGIIFDLGTMSMHFNSTTMVSMDSGYYTEQPNICRIRFYDSLELQSFINALTEFKDQLESYYGFRKEDGRYNERY